MTTRKALKMLAVAVGLAAGPAMLGFAQDTPRPKDDALDSLLEKLAGPSDEAVKKDEKSSTAKKNEADKRKSAEADKAGKDVGKPGQAAKGDKPQAKKAEDSAPLSGKDQEVDDLLQKLGETTETPAPDDRRRGGPGGGKSDDRAPSPKPGEKKAPDQLSGKDKETDEHLRELAGRKRRKQQEEEAERKGPAGELIKEMRDIEQKLAKPDTGEGTREEQKQVVKRIEKLIEEARKSGQSSIMRVVRRQGRKQQQQGGKQQGQTPGAMAQGAPAQKPAKPPTTHSKAGGKDIWGHLPPELRAEMENMINEMPLPAMEELIARYYLSVNKDSPKREETP